MWNAAGGTPAEVAELSAVLDRHCAEVGRDPTRVRRSVQLRLPDEAGRALAVAEDYVRVGVTEMILLARGGQAAADAKRAAGLLPRLRAIG